MNRRLVPFVAIQLAGGAAGFMLWVVMGSVAPEAFGTASLALTIGMIVYLPATLGMNSILPNLFRVPGNSTPLYVVWTTAIIASVLLLCGAILAFAGNEAAGIGLAFAAMITLSSMLQQFGRVRNRLGLMAIASLYNSVLPASITVAWILSSTVAGTGQLSVLLIACFSIAITVVLFTSAREYARPVVHMPRWRDAMRPVFRAAIPLVPHSLAIALLMQGVRVPAALGSSTADVAAANVVMLFVGLAFAFITAVNGVTTVGVQMAPTPEERAGEVRRASLILAVVGGSGALGLTISYWLLAPVLFVQTAPVDVVQLGALSAIPPLLCAYYVSSSILLSLRKTTILAFISVATSGGYLGVSVLMSGAGLASQLVGFVVALALLAAVTAVAANRGFAGSALLRTVGWPFGLALTPASLILLTGFLQGTLD